MRITLKFSGNVYNSMRQLGYHPHETEREKDGESSFVRRLSSADYPRFHAYVASRTFRGLHSAQDEEVINERCGISRGTSEQEVVINLHLDQKKPIYKGVSAHSGEYDGELVEREVERIKQAILGP